LTASRHEISTNGCNVSSKTTREPPVPSMRLARISEMFTGDGIRSDESVSVAKS
jgi:hypothetical protein